MFIFIRVFLSKEGVGRNLSPSSCSKFIILTFLLPDGGLGEPRFPLKGQCPSGLRVRFKLCVFVLVGSNPTVKILFSIFSVLVFLRFHLFSVFLCFFCIFLYFLMSSLCPLFFFRIMTFSLSIFM